MLTSCEEKQGKTVFSLITAKELSKEKKLLLVDLSNSEKDSSYYLNVKDMVIYDVVDLIKDTCSLEQAVIKIKEEEFEFDFLPAPRMKDKYKQLDLGHLKKIFMESNGNYDYIVIDGTTVADDIKTASYEIVDLVVMLTYNKVENIKCIFSSLNIISSDVKDIKLVINKTIEKEERKGNLLTTEEVEEILKVKVDGKIEFLPKLNSLEENFLNENNFKEVNRVIEKII